MHVLLLFIPKTNQKEITRKGASCMNTIHGGVIDHCVYILNLMVVAYLGDRCYYYLFSFVMGVDGLGCFFAYLFVVSSTQSIVLIGLLFVSLLHKIQL